MFRGDGGGRSCRAYRSRGVGVAQLGSAGKPGERFARSWFQRRNDGTRRAYEEERLSYLRSLQRHPAMKYAEVRSVVALKRGVGDHTPERFADHEPRRNANNGGFSAFGPAALDWKAVKRLIALT